MISVLIAALLQAAAPAAGPVGAPDNGLPKDDYSLVAWCHGALAGQLELDTVARADMEKIEGKAKVAQHAKEDAELEKARRQYLKDYEKALAAAEAASPTMIHAKGVAAEQSGYRMWAATRNKAPIWRMLDWGMWDANDAGCGDAAKRLYDRASLFGQALKGSTNAASNDQAAEPAAEPAAEAMAENAAPPSAAPESTAPPPAAPEPTAAPVSADPAAPPSGPVTGAPAPKAAKATKAKTTKAKVQAKSPHRSAEAVRAALEAESAASTAAPPPPPANAPAPDPTPDAPPKPQ